MHLPVFVFILRRLGSALVAVSGVLVLVFLFLHLAPGDPVDRLAGGDATQEQRDEIARCMGLAEGRSDAWLERSSLLAPIVGEPLSVNRPTGKWEQFRAYLGSIADGTLGHQCPNPSARPTVMERIAEKFPYTIELAIGGMLVAFLLALPLGIVAAVHRGTWVDALTAIVSLSGISMPVMFMGPMMIFFFFVHLGWLPGPADPDARLALLMPSIVIGTHLMAMLARMTRSSLVEVLREDYITTARAKGLPARTVLVKHALRNALLPVITVAGLQFGSLLGGAIVTEKIFERPGLGTLLLEGISERNYPVVQGTVLVIAICYVTVNTLVDVSYSFIDPRVRRG